MTLAGRWFFCDGLHSLGAQSVPVDGRQGNWSFVKETGGIGSCFFLTAPSRVHSTYISLHYSFLVIFLKGNESSCTLWETM